MYVCTHAVVVAANGEIYNYKELYEELGGTAFYKPKTGSDCEVGREEGEKSGRGGRGWGGRREEASKQGTRQTWH